MCIKFTFWDRVIREIGNNVYTERFLIATCVTGGSLIRLLSMFFMNSVVSLSLLLIGRLKLSPNCKRLCMSVSVRVKDRLTNHFLLMCKKGCFLSLNVCFLY